MVGSSFKGLVHFHHENGEGTEREGKVHLYLKKMGSVMIVTLGNASTKNS